MEYKAHFRGEATSWELRSSFVDREGTTSWKSW